MAHYFDEIARHFQEGNDTVLLCALMEYFNHDDHLYSNTEDNLLSLLSSKKDTIIINSGSQYKNGHPFFKMNTKNNQEVTLQSYPSSEDFYRELRNRFSTLETQFDHNLRDVWKIFRRNKHDSEFSLFVEIYIRRVDPSVKAKMISGEFFDFIHKFLEDNPKLFASERVKNQVLLDDVLYDYVDALAGRQHPVKILNQIVHDAEKEKMIIQQFNQSI